MKEINFMEKLHKSTKRDYTERIVKYDKAQCAEVSCKFGKDYWDGDRRYGYGGYKYMDGYWRPVAEAMVNHYKLQENARILDIGCGKGFLLYEITKILPKAEVYGIDISNYAVENAKEEVKPRIKVGNAISLPFENNSFDYVYALGCMHNLYNFELFKALKEMERVGKQNKYTMQESYRNETEKINMCNWQLTQHSFYSIQEWIWFFELADYTGDYGFIFFE
ncbi:MAG: class I SAM-dependent methyltransferase [Ignavibacteriales bacterium]|nr:class I SAM-dependent methyltransferase [Ignavibacteriales bacterium]